MSNYSSRLIITLTMMKVSGKQCSSSLKCENHLGQVEDL